MQGRIEAEISSKRPGSGKMCFIQGRACHRMSDMSHDSRYSRRRFLSISTAAGLAGFGASCSKKAAGEKVLHLYTWADYFNPEVIKRFEAAHSCKVEMDTFDANEAMYAKLKAGATGYDVITPSSYMVRTLAREGMLMDLPHDKLPNLSNIDREYLKSALDPEMKHSVPYMMAPTCLAYLKSKIPDAPRTWRLLEKPEIKGRATMLNDMREVLGAALKALGHSLNSTDPAQLAAARDLAILWKKNIAKFENEQYKTGLASGEFWLVHGYAGDIMQVAEENDDIELFIPGEGTAFSCDDFVILKNAPKADLALAFINYMCDGQSAADNMTEVSYRAPNTAGYALLPGDFRKNEVLFPPAEVFAKCEVLDDLGESLPLWTKTWDEVKAG
jgi:spermidine/putrescine transport system substrate-binding protein